MKACLVRHTHHYGFRSGEWAEILACVVHLPSGNPAYHVRFIDGVEDYFVIRDPTEPYEFKAGRELTSDDLSVLETAAIKKVRDDIAMHATHGLTIFQNVASQWTAELDAILARRR